MSRRLKDLTSKMRSLDEEMLKSTKVRIHLAYNRLIPRRGLPAHRQRAKLRIALTLWLSVVGAGQRLTPHTASGAREGAEQPHTAAQ